MSERKPLGGKAYGSIGHLPCSRMGPADHHVHPGQAAICIEKSRDRHDRIIVTEKVDGACVSVANVDGQIVALIRAGYTAETAHYEHLRIFGRWVDGRREQFLDVLAPGERLVGEWMALAHGTVYRVLPHDPWVIFDAFRGGVRMTFDEVLERASVLRLASVPVLSDGPAFRVEDALSACGETGAFGAEGGPEGVVYRVERKGKVDFLAKYVRPDKADGAFLPEISGQGPVWHRNFVPLAEATNDHRS